MLLRGGGWSQKWEVPSYFYYRYTFLWLLNMWIGFFLLAGLGAFIIWDSRRLRNEKVVPLSRSRMKDGFMPQGLIPWHAYLAMGGINLVLAFLEWEKPGVPPFTGRWAWLHQGLFEAFGSRGLFGFWLVIGLLAVVYAVALKKKTK